ncbi:hypothetical protein HPB48_009582 [Haemaphysalis longicornis]|uniref:Uncharacterized protein n=1 Tax=Haemaphysalis longicornis TaxID=44386 RepID=A0A9J6FAP6_HAELO|nr:hypothetical protein HPB48_009582 [Haemaphysalis longicornis]
MSVADGARSGKRDENCTVEVANCKCGSGKRDDKGLEREKEVQQGRKQGAEDIRRKGGKRNIDMVIEKFKLAQGWGKGRTKN